MDKYVKKLDVSTWEVKLGAGITPIKIADSEVKASRLWSASTVALPHGITLEEHRKKINAIAMVNEHIAESKEP